MDYTTLAFAQGDNIEITQQGRDMDSGISKAKEITSK